MLKANQHITILDTKVLLVVVVAVKSPMNRTYFGCDIGENG
jgi:hypothetical protein